MFKQLYVGIAAVMMFPGMALAAGLQSDTTDIVVTNLRIGQTYNLTELANMPFRIKSTNIETRVRITLLVPATGQTNTGYEPIPDTSWISLSQSEFLLKPGETGLSDMTITIPNDESLLGKKFETYIFARTVPLEDGEATVAFGIGIRGSLRFTVAPKSPTEKELVELKKARTRMFSISLLPNEMLLDDIPLGKKVSVEKEKGKFLKLVNTGEEPVKVRIASIPMANSGIEMPKGWEGAPDPSWLKLNRSVITLKPLEIKKIGFNIVFPEDEKYKDKSYVFLIDVSTADELIKISHRSRIHVTTK